VATDPLVPKILSRLRRTDATGARIVERALAELLDDGGLADLTQHDLQTFLWFTLPQAEESYRVASALAAFLELADMNRYAAIASSAQTTDVLRAYDERGRAAGIKAGTKAMDASGILPPDVPELEWSEVMGTEEMLAYEQVAAALELALAVGELKPGARGWRVAQVRLAHHQLTMDRPDGPTLLDRVRAERVESWAETGGQARRLMAASVLDDLAAEPSPPRDLTERMAPMQWLLETAAGRPGDGPGIALTVTGNLARKVVQDAADRFGWWDLERPPRSESDIWRLAELRAILQGSGALRRTARKLVLGPRGRNLLGEPLAQWQLATSVLLDPGDFDGAAQEAAILLLLGASGMVRVHELIREVADVLTGSGWRDTGNGAPPDESAVSRAVVALVRRCELWDLIEQSRSPESGVRVRLSDAGRRGAVAALRAVALRPRLDPDS
jgi:hypothetical protein